MGDCVIVRLMGGPFDGDLHASEPDEELPMQLTIETDAGREVQYAFAADGRYHFVGYVERVEREYDGD